MFLIFAINGDIPGTISVLYGTDKFHWDGVTVGLWLAVFGALPLPRPRRSSPGR